MAQAIICECNHCHSQYKRKASYVTTDTKRFCSLKCRMADKGVSVTCLSCQKEFMLNKEIARLKHVLTRYAEDEEGVA